MATKGDQPETKNQLQKRQIFAKQQDDGAACIVYIYIYIYMHTHIHIYIDKGTFVCQDKDNGIQKQGRTGN